LGASAHRGWRLVARWLTRDVSGLELSGSIWQGGCAVSFGVVESTLDSELCCAPAPEISPADLARHRHSGGDAHNRGRAENARSSASKGLAGRPRSTLRRNPGRPAQRGGVGAARRPFPAIPLPCRRDRSIIRVFLLLVEHLIYADRFRRVCGDEGSSTDDSLYQLLRKRAGIPAHLQGARLLRAAPHS